MATYANNTRTRIEPNLFVLCGPTGATSWVFSYKIGTKRVNMGLGALHTVSLKLAREQAAGLRLALLQGRDPRSEKRSTVVAGGGTFEKFLDAEIARIATGHKDGQQTAAWRASFKGLPLLSMPVAKVDVAHVVDAVTPVWLCEEGGVRKIGEQLLTRIVAVLENAQASGARAETLSVSLVKRLLPVGKKLIKASHAALSGTSLPAFFASLTQTNMATLGLRFLILTAVRSSEAREAQWSEIDLDAATWTIPAARMKAGRDHVVPLSTQALAILADLRARRSNGAFVFSNDGGVKPISVTAFGDLKVIKDSDFTVHGFRSTFADWATENLVGHGFTEEDKERCLAHLVGTKVARAYTRTDGVDKRRAMMQAWADFATASRPANVIPLAA